MKARLIEIFGHTVDCYECGSTFYYPANVGDWEDISDQEYAYLCKWVYQKNNQSKGMQYKICRESDIPLKLCVKEVIEKDKKDKQVKEAARIKAEEKKKLLDAQREEKCKAKELKKLQELTKKYGTTCRDNVN